MALATLAPATARFEATFSTFQPGTATPVLVEAPLRVLAIARCAEHRLQHPSAPQHMARFVCQVEIDLEKLALLVEPCIGEKSAPGLMAVACQLLPIFSSGLQKMMK